MAFSSPIAGLLAVPPLFFNSSTPLPLSGAFEIDFNGINMWSKIQTGRIPTGPELFQMIESNIEMAGGGTKFT